MTDQTERHAQNLKQLVAQSPGTTYAELKKRSGLTEATFLRALKHAKKEGLLTGGGRNRGYNLGEDKRPADLPSGSPPPLFSYREMEVMEVSDRTAMEANWRLVGGEGNTCGRKKTDSTAGDEIANDFKEAVLNGKRGPEDLVAKALEQLRAGKSRPAGAR